MKVFLASPNNQLQAHCASGMPVLLSYACYSPWLADYTPTFEPILVDSGAYSELNSGVRVDIGAYKEWSAGWRKHAWAIAGLDDIRGDYKRSLRNYAEIPWSFPTIHDSDPKELLPELVSIARERNTWLGIGLVPPREGKEQFVRWVCDNVPEDIHIHGWALRRYTYVRRLDSVDSCNWFMDAMKYRKQLPWLTYGEALDVVIKRYQRWERIIKDEEETVVGLFDEMVA